MLLAYLISCWLILSNVVESLSNEFDTYNADNCKRVRRKWSTLTTDEKQLYIDGLMILREQGQLDMDKDEFIAIGSAHENKFGEIEHGASSYLFWHGYLLWELESRIRNLGGEYSCFGMPYWEFSNGEAGDQIFDDIIGGTGDPEDYWTVNGFSWDYTTKQFWVPAHCDAEGDHYPICSLKRSTSDVAMPDATDTGYTIINNPSFADFDVAYAASVNLPHNVLTSDSYLYYPVVTSYDPIWYLFHSMVSYHQAIWTDCNNYDLIAPNKLDGHPEAYQAFCLLNGCPGMNLDDKMKYGGALPDAQWSFIHSNDLTIRKSYHFPRWNIIYDLGNGDGFFTDSGLKDYCKGKLNPEWFILQGNDDEYQSDNEKIFSSLLTVNVSAMSANQIVFSIASLVFIVFCIVYSFQSKSKEIKQPQIKYGSVV